MATKKEKLEKLDILDNEGTWELINKEFGGDAVFKASDPIHFQWEVINFPSLSLGDATHLGGVPLDGITMLYGREGSTKTMQCHLLCAQAQKQFPGCDILWFDAETNYNRTWAMQLGVDINHVRVVPKNNAVEVFRIMGGKWKDGKKVADGVFDHIKSGKLNVKLIIIDSIASLEFPSETGRDFSEFEIGAASRFLPRALKKIRAFQAGTKCALVFINQARANMNPMAKTLTYSGGFGLRHCLDLSILLTASTAAENKMEEDGKKIANKILCVVDKTRGGPNGYGAEMWVNYTKGVIKVGEEAATLAHAYGIVSRPNNTTWEYKEHSIRGAANFGEFLENNPLILAEIVAEIKLRKSNAQLRNAVLSFEGAAVAEMVEEEPVIIPVISEEKAG